MIQTLLLRKLAFYVAYAAVVALLPVSASNLSGGREPPASTVVSSTTSNIPESDFQGADAPHSGRQCDCADCQCSVCQCDERWWCRGPLRRGVRGVAMFLSRPWRR